MKDSTIEKYVKMYKRVYHYNHISKQSANYLKISITELYNKVAEDFYCESGATVRIAVGFVNKKLKEHDVYVQQLLKEEE